MMSDPRMLSGLEFVGLLNGVAPGLMSGAVLTMKPDAPATLHRDHLASTGASPAEVVADLVMSICRLRPYEITEPQSLQPNLVLAIAAITAYLDKIGRRLHLEPSADDLPSHAEGELIDLLREAYDDPHLARGQLVSRLTSLIPSDTWSVANEATPLLAGVTAGIAYAVSGVPEGELARIRVLASEIKQELESFGFTVRLCTEHPVGEDCSNECPVNRNVDALVVLYPRASTRVGHQVKGVADLLGLTLVLVPRDVKDVTCLFKSKELGRFVTRRFDTPMSARAEVRKFVAQHAALLDAHAMHRVKRDQWHQQSFFELRTRIAERMAANSAPIGPGLMTKAIARHLVSSIDVYSGASITIINSARELVGLPPLGTNAESTYDTLFSLEQLFELDRLITSGDIASKDRPELLARAARGMVAAGRNLDNRNRTFLGPDDWLGESRALLASRRDR